MIKEKNTDLKNMLMGIGIIFLYLIMSALPYDFLSIFGINYNSLNTFLKEVYLIIYEIVLLIIIILIYKEDFINNFKEFKKNMFKYLKKYIKYWFLMLVLMLISNGIITMFTTSYTSQNQQTIIEQFKIAPVYTFIVTVFIAPILEELVFRISFRKIFMHTNFLFIFFSGFFFGLIHVIGSLENPIDLLFIIPYSIPGFIFAYLYNKSKNICIPISLHIIHNLVMMLIQIILIIL